MEYRDQHCLPKPIEECIISEKEIVCPMQDAADHQLGKLFSVVEPNLKNKMLKIKSEHPEAYFEGSIKWGMYR